MYYWISLCLYRSDSSFNFFVFFFIFFVQVVVYVLMTIGIPGWGFRWRNSLKSRRLIKVCVFYTFIHFTCCVLVFCCAALLLRSGWIVGLAALKTNAAVGVIMLLNALVLTAQAAMGVVLLKKVNSLKADFKPGHILCEHHYSVLPQPLWT